MHEQFHLGSKVNDQRINSKRVPPLVRALAFLPLSPVTTSALADRSPYSDVFVEDEALKRSDRNRKAVSGAH